MLGQVDPFPPVAVFILETDEQTAVLDIDVENDVAAVRRDAWMRLVFKMGLDGQPFGPGETSLAERHGGEIVLRLIPPDGFGRIISARAITGQIHPRSRVSRIRPPGGGPGRRVEPGRTAVFRLELPKKEQPLIVRGNAGMEGADALGYLERNRFHPYPVLNPGKKKGRDGLRKGMTVEIVLLTVGRERAFEIDEFLRRDDPRGEDLGRHPRRLLAEVGAGKLRNIFFLGINRNSR